MTTGQSDQFSILIKAIAECVIEALSDMLGANRVHMVTYMSCSYDGSQSPVMEIWYGTSTSDRIYIVKANNAKKYDKLVPCGVEAYVIRSGSSLTDILVTSGDFDPDHIKNRLLQDIGLNMQGLILI